MPLGPEIIHSVINPIKRLTGAIHVYWGDFFAVPRSEWDPEHLVEGPYDVAKTLALFAVQPSLPRAGAPRLHPGITQEVAPNESQRAPKAANVKSAN